MNEVRIIDPETGAMKGRKLERYDLLFGNTDALDEIARVYAFGSVKYEDFNYLKGYAWSLSLGALLRHVACWSRGEDLDPESGHHHLAHAAWHCITLLMFAKLGKGKDDRAPR